MKRYRLGRHEVQALNGVSLRVEAGSIVAVIGPSGSGKSTLLYLLGCLDRPTSGDVLLDGRLLSTLPDRQLPEVRRIGTGFVFQRFHLLPTLTALENVMLPLRYAHVARARARERALEALGAVEMTHRLTHRPGELSGGEQQRVAIARALVNRPKIILADEPTGELDSSTAAHIVKLLTELNQSRGQTLIVVTHDPVVAALAHRIVSLRDGRVERDSSA